MTSSGRWIVSTWFLVVSTISCITATPDVLKDYCEDESFEAECGSDEVVVMTFARYGRMRKDGHCMTSADYINIGCFADALAHFDAWCSGRRSCKVKVNRLMEELRPCNRDLRSYVEAKYACVKVQTPDPVTCRTTADAVATSQQGGVMTSSSSGHVASLSAELSPCGGVDRPWTLHVTSGQRLNITVYDFSQQQLSSSPSSSSSFATGTGVITSHVHASAGTPPPQCQVVVVMRERLTTEGGGTRTICQGRGRVHTPFVTHTNEVEIRFYTKKRAEEQAYFLIGYETVGCPDHIDDIDGELVRSLDGATIRCANSDVTWPVKCVKNKWQGFYGNCTEGTGIQSGAAISDQNQQGSFQMSQAISVIIVAIIAIIIGLTVLVLGLRFFKRSHRYDNPQQFAALRKTDPAKDYYTTTGSGSPMNSDVIVIDKHQRLVSSLPGGGGEGKTNTSRFVMQQSRWPQQQHHQQQLPHTDNRLIGLEHRRTNNNISNMMDDSAYDARYAEHIYESPASLTRGASVSGERNMYDMANGSTSGSAATQYYEMAPGAVLQQGQAMPHHHRGQGQGHPGGPFIGPKLAYR